MSNRFCYIWPSTTDHGTSVIDRIPLKSLTMASSQSVSGWPWRQLWLFWRPRPLNSACADGLKLGSTNLTSDYPAIKSDPRSIAILIWSALVKQNLVDQIGWPRILIQIKLDLDWWNAPLVVTRLQCCCGRCKGCAPPIGPSSELTHAGTPYELTLLVSTVLVLTCSYRAWIVVKCCWQNPPPGIWCRPVWPAFIRDPAFIRTCLRTSCVH